MENNKGSHYLSLSPQDFKTLGPDGKSSPYLSPFSDERIKQRTITLVYTLPESCNGQEDSLIPY